MAQSPRSFVGVKYAVLIGVDASDELPSAPFASDEVRAFAARLEVIGFARTNQTLLIGPSATRSAVKSRLRKVGRELAAGDEVWFVFAGPSFVEAGQTNLAFTDTQADDRSATAVALREAIDTLTVEAGTIRVFLDGPTLSELPPNAVVLMANSPGESSHAGAGRRLWLRLIGDALAGLAPAALIEGQLTAGSLHAWLTKELPRAIRKEIATPGSQTPQLFGRADTVLAEITSSEPATARLDLKQLKRIVFRGEARTRVKDLSGFQKSFKLPESASPSSQKWAYRLAADDLKSTIEDTYNALREQLGFKRKDLESSVGPDGIGFIRGPSFDFTVSVSLDPDDPTGVIWRREVSQVRDPSVLRSEGFRRVFGGKLDTLEFAFVKPIDVEKLVDRIEDDMPAGVRVRVASDGSMCDITVQGFSGRIHVERGVLRIEGRPGLTPDSLVEQFFAFQNQFGRALPAIRGKAKR